VIPPAAAEGAPREIGRLKEEIQRLEAENQTNRHEIEELRHKMEQLDTQQQEHNKELEGQIAASPRRYIERYWGEDRFVLTGWGAGT